MDFRIPDLVRIWDSIFAMFADSTRQAAKAVSAADSEARAFLLDLCVAMVLVKRGELLSSSVSQVDSSCSATIRLRWFLPVLSLPQHTSELRLRRCSHSPYTRLLYPGTSYHFLFDWNRNILLLFRAKLPITRRWRVLWNAIT